MSQPNVASVYPNGLPTQPNVHMNLDGNLKFAVRPVVVPTPTNTIAVNGTGSKADTHSITTKNSHDVGSPVFTFHLGN